MDIEDELQQEHNHAMMGDHKNDNQYAVLGHIGRTASEEKRRMGMMGGGGKVRLKTQFVPRDLGLRPSAYQEGLPPIFVVEVNYWPGTLPRMSRVLICSTPADSGLTHCENHDHSISWMMKAIRVRRGN